MAEFKSKVSLDSPFQRAKSMDELRRNMTERGLNFIKRDQPKQMVDNEDAVDPEKEEEIKTEFLGKCAAAGLHWGLCEPFEVVPDDAPVAKHHASQVWVHATRFNSHFKKSTVFWINLGMKQVQYIEKEKISRTRVLLGSKPSNDLVSKTKLHIWFRGEKAPMQHTLYDEAEFHGVANDDDDDDVEEELGNDLSLNKFEEHSPRDHATNVASIRTSLDFPIIEIHKGVLEKRGKSGYGFKSRYCRVVNGHVIIYREPTAYIPMDSVCLFGTKIKPKSSHTFKLKGKERSFYFRCAHKKDRDQWITALNLAKVRAVHEWKMLVVHLEWQKKRARALRHAKHMHSTHSLKHVHSMGALTRGYSMSLDPNKQSLEYDQWLESAHLKSVALDDVKEHPAEAEATPPSARRRLKKGRKKKKKKSRPSSEDSPPKVAPRSVPRKAASARPQSARRRKAHRRGQSYTGGRGEFEVQLSGVPLGFIEVQDTDTLANFRKKIMDELDNVPESFIFLRDTVPVGHRQEKKKMIDYVVSDNYIVSLKEEPMG